MSAGLVIARLSVTGVRIEPDGVKTKASSTQATAGGASTGSMSLPERCQGAAAAVR